MTILSPISSRINKNRLDAMPCLMKDLCDNSNIRGNTVLLLAENFRLTLSVISHGAFADEMNASIQSSELNFLIFAK